MRQPNKQGMERFVDPAFHQKLSGMEAKFQELMAEREREGREEIGQVTVDHNGYKRSIQREWYQNQFYEDMTYWYCADPRKRMETHPGVELRGKSKMGSFALASLDYGEESPMKFSTSSVSPKKKVRTASTVMGAAYSISKKGGLANTQYSLPKVAEEDAVMNYDQEERQSAYDDAKMNLINATAMIKGQGMAELKVLKAPPQGVKNVVIAFGNFF